MINTGLIGYGNWGKKIKKILQKNTNLIFVADSKTNFKKKLNEVDWVFIATPDETHFKLVKLLLKNKKNIFCEKPLAIRNSEAKLLFKLAKKYQVKIYVSDIENFRKKILYNKKNLIIRENNSNLNYKNILNRWFYHDFYQIFIDQEIIHLKISNVKLNKRFSFSLSLNNKVYHFLYNEYSKNKKYFHNNINLYKSKKNKLKIMINKIITNKVNYDLNKKIALKTIYGVNFLRNKIYSKLKIKDKYL
jgi:hypothetical protein